MPPHKVVIVTKRRRMHGLLAKHESVVRDTEGTLAAGVQVHRRFVLLAVVDCGLRILVLDCLAEECLVLRVIAKLGIHVGGRVTPLRLMHSASCN